jgi:hypothetical protein
MRGKPDGECFYIVFHVASITLYWLHVNRDRNPALPALKGMPIHPLDESQGLSGLLQVMLS